MIVLLHGFGAPGSDLVGLADAIDAPPGTRFVFPEAPHMADLGYPPSLLGPDPPRAWWPLDVPALQLALQQGRMNELADQAPAGLGAARETLDAALGELMQEWRIGPDRIVLGGFSQGAMLSTELALKSSGAFRALLLLSGTLLAETEWRRLIQARTPKLRFFQSHATDDPILPFSLAERLHALLTDAGHDGRFVTFQGGHGIPTPVLTALGTFLQEVADT